MIAKVTLAKVIGVFQLGLAMAPPHVDNAGLSAWEVSHVNRQRALRNLIGVALVASGDGHYMGTVGDHGIDIGGIAIIGGDGFQSLIEQWLAVAIQISTTGSVEESA